MIVVTLRRLFAPLTLAFESRSAAMVLLEDLGWTPEESFQLDAFEHLAPVQEKLTALMAVIEAYDPDDPDVGSIVEQAVLLAGDINAAISALSEMSAGNVSNLVSPLNTPVFWQELALDLPDYLILTYLRLYMGPLYALLAFGGAIVDEERPNGRPPRQVIDWEALGRLLRDPAGQIRTFYDWGGTLEHVRLMTRLGDVLRALGLPVFERDIPAAIVAERYGEIGAGPARALSLPLLERLRSRALDEGMPSLPAGTAGASLDLLLAAVPARSDTQKTPDGLLLSFAGRGTASMGLNLGKGWLLSTAATLDLSGLFGLELQPSGLSLATGTPAGSLGLTLTGQPDEPWLLMGEPGKTRLELARLRSEAALSADASGADMTAGVSLEGLQVVICAGEGDGFLSNVLNGAEVTVPITFGLDYATDTGLRFNGGAGVEIEIVVDEKLGPAHLQLLTIGAGIGADGVNLSAAVSGSLTLGPFTAVLGGIGMEARFTPNPRGAGGRSGPISTRIGFKPPDSIGLSVEAPGVEGGGFLLIDHEAGRYAGALEIKLFGFEVTAIGMIATRLPSGEEGWSLFLSISIIFPKSIPLVFGFSLSGIGGLIGVHRGIDVEALGDAVRSGNLDNVLFPQDVIANAPMILSALDTIFPSQKGQFAFGPMFQISWGAKGLVTLQLGVAIQLPEPVSISLLGSFQLRIGLPEETAPGLPETGEEKPPKDIILIRVDVVGTLLPAEGKLAIDASISEGFIAGLTLSGDMAVRMEFSNRPNLVVAMGGFHPDFTAPEGFPRLSRLSIKIFDDPKLRVGVEAYLALAPNALQFGVAAFFHAKALGFTAEGRFEFDTIIIFKPFGLEASLGFQITVSAGSVELLQVRLRGTLKGPKPWFITGYAEFKVACVKKKFRVELTVGRAVASEPRESVALFDMVLTALEEAEAWGPVEAEGALYEAVRYTAPAGETLFHPAGGIEINQGIAPLGIALERFGENRLAEEDRHLHLEDIRLSDAPVASVPVQNWFSPGQFFELTEEEKVSSPSFEDLDSGVSFGEGGAEFAPADPFDLGYESIVVDPDVEARFGRDLEGRSQGAAQIIPQVAQPKAGLALDLTPRTVTGMTVQKPEMELVATETPVTEETPQRFAAFTAALSQQRSLKAKGIATQLRPAYERNLEDGT